MTIYVIHQDFLFDGKGLNQWRWYYTDNETAWKAYVKMVKDFESESENANYELAKDYNGNYCRDGEDYEYYEMVFNNTKSLHSVRFTFFTAHTH